MPVPPRTCSRAAGLGQQARAPVLGLKQARAEDISKAHEAIRALHETLATEQAAHHATRQRLELYEHRGSGGGGGGVSHVINANFWPDAKAIGFYEEFTKCFEPILVTLFELPDFDAADAVQRASRDVLGAATAYFEGAYRAERARLQALPDQRDAGAVSRAMRSEFCFIETDAHVQACVGRCVAVLPLDARFVANRHNMWVKRWISVQCWLRLNLEDIVDVASAMSGRERFDAARHSKCGPVPDDGECVVIIPPFILAGRVVLPGVVCV